MSETLATEELRGNEIVFSVDIMRGRGGEKRRKGGGLPWSASGASGILGSFAGMGGKVAVIALVGTLGVGAYGVGQSMAPDSSTFLAEKKPKAFASTLAQREQKYEGDTTHLPKPSRGAVDSLGMVSGSLDGKTSEERATEAAAAQAAQKAEAEKAAKAEADAAKEQATPTASAALAAGVMDPAVLAAAAAKAGQAEKTKGSMGGKIGELSKGFGSGGGLSGGGGMAGGVGRGFDMKIKGDSGRSLAFGNSRANVSYAKSSLTRSTPSGQRGLARRQLDKASQLSNQARSGTDVARRTNADAAFNLNPGAGTTVTSEGAGPGRSPVGNSVPSGPAPSGGSGGGSDRGGPLASAGDGTSDPDDCASLGSGFTNSAVGGCVLKTEKGKSVDPTDVYFNFLKVLAIIATVLSVLLVVVGLFCKTLFGSMFYPVLQALAGALVVVGGLMTLLGLMVVGMGRTIEGGIFAGIGLLTTIGGYVAYSTATEDRAIEQEAATDAAQKASTEAAEKAAVKSSLNEASKAGGDAVASSSESVVSAGSTSENIISENFIKIFEAGQKISWGP